MHRTVTAVAIIALLTGCAGDSVTMPTWPPRSFFLRGSISDTVYRPVEGAALAVLDGPQAGIVMFTDGAGNFSFESEFTEEFTLRISKVGFLEQSNLITYPVAYKRGGLSFVLESATPAVDLTGSYSMTFSADSSCTVLPPALRARSYAAELKRADPYSGGTDYDGTVSGAAFVSEYDYLWGAVSGNVVRLFFEPTIEQIGPDAYFIIEGTAEGTIAGSTSELTFSGSAELCEGRRTDIFSFLCSVTPLECASGTHRLTLARQ
jgi:hypothetical protein